MADMRGYQVWGILKPILEKRGWEKRVFAKDSEFINEFGGQLSRFVPNIRCGQSQLFIFGLACIKDDYFIPGYDAVQGLKDMEFLFERMNHSCFEKPAMVLALIHYITVGTRKIDSIVVAAIEKLLETAHMDVDAEIKRFIYAVDCDNKAFSRSLSDTAEPTPYGISMAKNLLQADSDEWYAHMGSFIDYVSLRGVQGLRELPKALPPVSMWSQHIQVKEGKIKIESESEEVIIMALSTLLLSNIIKRSF